MNRITEISFSKKKLGIYVAAAMTSGLVFWSLFPSKPKELDDDKPKSVNSRPLENGIGQHDPSTKGGTVANTQGARGLEVQRQELKALLDNGEIDALLSRLTELYQDEENAEIAAEIAMVYWHEMKDPERAKYWLQNAVKKNPSHSEAVYELINLHHELGTLETEMLPFLRNLPATQNLEVAQGDILARLGRNEESRNLLERNLEHLESRQLIQLAAIRTTEQDVAGADDLRIRAWNNFKTHADEGSVSRDEFYRYQALSAYDRAGDDEHAKEILQGILLDNPDKVTQFESILQRLGASN